MSFTVAIVGRPNVGKSTLFNRLAGKRLALVHDLPGVTRDRREAQARLGDLTFTAIDTAGLEEAALQTLSGRMQEQTQAAINSADAVMFLIDARAGSTPVDRAFADLVRKSGKPAILIANKSEGSAGEAGILEAYELGLGEPIAISAEHGEGLADLYAGLRAALPDVTTPSFEAQDHDVTGDIEQSAAEGRQIRIAVVGRPNSGKSTLVNRLLGEERLLTGPEAGITRDAIAVDLAWRDRRFRVHDTAGLRRRSRVEAKLEKLSVTDALHAVRFAEVVVLLMDAQKPFEEQDLRIADLIAREGRALVIGMNKWDLAERGAGAIKTLREEADHWLPQVKRVSVAAVSALTGEGLDRMMQAVVGAHAVWNRRVGTSALNRWLAEVVASHPPPGFVLFTSRANALPAAYRRYLVNSLRETFDLPGIPIRLALREKPNPFA